MTSEPEHVTPVPPRSVTPGTESGYSCYSSEVESIICKKRKIRRSRRKRRERLLLYHQKKVDEGYPLSKLQIQQLNHTPVRTGQRPCAPLQGKRLEPEFCRISEEPKDIWSQGEQREYYVGVQVGQCGSDQGGQWGGVQAVQGGDQSQSWTSRTYNQNLLRNSVTGQDLGTCLCSPPGTQSCGQGGVGLQGGGGRWVEGGDVAVHGGGGQWVEGGDGAVHGGGQSQNLDSSRTINFNSLNNSVTGQHSCSGQFSPSCHQSSFWVCQLGSFSECPPAYCCGCQSWGAVTLVKLG